MKDTYTEERCDLCGGIKKWVWHYKDTGEFIVGDIVEDCQCGKESRARAIETLARVLKAKT